MPALGQAKSSKFQIGSAEIRVGALARAGQLTQADSIGLLQSATVNYTQEATDLEGGLPKATIATVITKTGLTVAASAYEYTMKNMKIMMNDSSAFSASASSYIKISAKSGGSSAGATDAAVFVPLSTSDISGTYLESIDSGAVMVLNPVVTADATVGKTFKVINAGSSATQTSFTIGDKVTLGEDTANQFTIAAVTSTISGSTLTGLSLRLQPGSGLAVPATTSGVTSIKAVTSAVLGFESTTVGTAPKTTATAISTVASVSGLVVANDIVIAYPLGQPENMSVLVVTSASGTTINFDNTKTPLLFELSAGSVIYKADNAGIGGNTTTSYFAMDIIGKDQSTGKPMGFQLWKVAVTSGLDFSFSGDAWGTTSMAFKAMIPTSAELASGGALQQISGYSTTNPYGRYLSGN